MSPTDVRWPQALEEREARLAHFLSQFPGYLWSTDRDLRITFSRGRGLEAVGLKQDEAVGRYVADMAGPSDPTTIPLELTRRALAGEIVDRVVTWRGRRMHVSLHPLRDEHGEIQGTVGMSMDVTERTRAEQALRASEARYRMLFQGSRDALFVLASDETGEARFVEVNESACRLLGYPRERLLALRPTGLGLDLARIVGELEGETLAPSSPGVFPCSLRRSDGREVDVEVTSQRFEWNGQIAIKAAARDVTERRDLERQLLHLQKMEILGRIAGSIAHDFNNELMVVSTFAAIALERLSPDDEARGAVLEVSRASQRAKELAKELLTFSRRQVLRPRLIGLNDVVGDLEMTLRHAIGRDCELVVDLAPDLALVRADPGRIGQVLLNLGVNARDAMRAPGTLTIRSENRMLERYPVVTPPGVVSGAYVSLMVRDTGEGIPENVMEHLFEPFFTTKDPGKGTGLGLSSCYGIITQSDGHIAVESTPGAGATFWLFFPAVPDSETPRQDGDSSGGPA